MAEPHSAIGSLMHEHQLILRVVDDLRLEMERTARDGSVDVEYVRTVVDFIRAYADRCHHGKEEDILFRDLAEKEMPEELAAEMERLIEDHVWARQATRRMLDLAESSNAESGAYRELTGVMGELAAFYPDHIEREDHHFFKPAIELLRPVEREAMAAQFEEFDRHLFHEEYRARVTHLEERRQALSAPE